MQFDTVCPICKSDVSRWKEDPNGCDGNDYDCGNCGKFFISRTAIAMTNGLDSYARAFLSHQIWQNQAVSKPYVVTSTQIENSKGQHLPDPGEQLDNLILFWGDSQRGVLSKQLSLSEANLCAKIGARVPSDVGYVAQEAIDQGLIKGSAENKGIDGCLTFKGWQRHRDIGKGNVRSRTAFMAMQFNNEVLVRIVDEKFRPAVQETGFRLIRVDDEPQAGLIDNKMRVDIRMSRFLIADLSDGNYGAYWEAGFAEGLDKPVIYTCSKSFFEEHKTHFDTNHCHTVQWESDNPQLAAENLKATIRATLPFEAKMFEY